MRILIALVFLFSTAGGQPLTGPREVSGTLGGSVSVDCSYEAKYHDHSKYWCRGTTRLCNTLIKTSISEREVRVDRVTIRDSPQTGSFTVLMEGLRREDAGSYWCGIDRSGLLDHMAPVSVVVLTASSTLPPTTISVTTASFNLTPAPSASTNAPSNTNTESSGTWSSDWIVLYLLPAGAFLLILLILAAVFLIRSQRNKKKAFDGSFSPNNGTRQPPDRPPDLMQSPSYAVVNKPPASASATPDTCYAEIRDLEPETAGSQGVSYADIQFDEAEQQQDVYINMQVIRKDPALECEYDTVRA